MRNGFVIAFILTGLAAACSFAPKDTGTAFMFTLKPINVVQQGAAKETLVVALPAAPAEIDTARIAILRSGGQWDYYAGAKWADFVPQLAQQSMIKTLEAARIFKSVAADASGITGDKVLKSEIRSFQAEYAKPGAAPTVKVRMVMSLLTRVDRVPVLSFEIAASKKAAADGLPQIQAAFVSAFNDAQLQAVEAFSRYRPE